MKKLFALLAVAIGVVACQKDQADFGVNLGGEQDVNITVSLPDETRAGSAQGFDLNNLNGYKVRYILEISYNGHVVRDVQTAETKSVVFPVRLAPGRDYQFTVWADLVKEGQNDLYYNVLTNAQEGVSALSNITFKTWTPNTEARDAWTDTKSIKFGENPDDLSMTLTRPFAKVRVVATDLAKVTYFGITPKSAVAVYSKDMYTSFNAVAGKANTTNVEQKNHTFAYEDVDTYEDATGQFTVFTDYILVPADGTVQFNLEVKDANGGTIKSTNFSTAIPVEKNKVTSIVGDVLTEGGNVSVTVDGALGQKETYTYISDGAELIKAMTKDGKYILGNDITVTEADLTRAQRNSATRAAANEPKNTVINLNGYTISVKNTGSGALVTVDEGNTLTFAGEGNIVMDEDSTAPFVENKNENGGVIIEEATVTNESTNQEATIVDGTAVVNEGVVITGTVASGDTTSQLDYVLTNGGEVTLLADVDTANTLAVTTTNPVVINGNNKIITYTGSDRAFTVENTNDVKTANVTLNDLTFVNTASYCQRGINFNVAGKLTLNNVKVSETGTPATYAINLPGSSDGAEVVINNSTIRGNIALNIWGENVVVDATNTIFSNYDSTEVEDYTTIVLNNDGSTVAEGAVVNIIGGKVIGKNEKDEPVYAVSNGTVTGVVNISETTEVIGAIKETVAIVDYNSTSFYSFTTIQDAIDKVCKDKKGFVRLVKDITVDETITIPADGNVTIDLNGKTITGTDSDTSSFGLITNRGNLLVKNGTMTLKAENNRGWNAYSSVISNNPGGNLVVEDAIIEHLGGTDMAYGIDNLTNGKGTYAETTVNNGAVIKSCYRAIRQFLNGIEAQNILTVNAGAVVDGANKSIWMQDPSAKANTGKLVVNEGVTLNGDVYLFVTAGSTEWPVEVSIAASAVNGEVLTGNVPAGYAVKNINGTWEVLKYTVVNTPAAIRSEVAKDNAVVYIENGDYKLEGKLSFGKNVTILGNGASLFNDWSSNAFANQAHFTNTYVENINFTNNLVIDAGIVTGDVKFVNCVFGGDRAHQGVHFDSGNGTLTFDDCTFVGRNMLGASIENVAFNNCTFLNKKSSLTGADKWTGVNMWGKYEFNVCTFDTEAHCNVKCDGVVATFTGCTYINGEAISEEIIQGTEANIAGSTITIK